jgi:2-hydroxychromene-2-carboxylate isomerase
MKPIPFYFDFVSPYSWLALRQARPFAAAHGIDWEMRPVVYAALLDAAGLVGPVESPAKRTYTFVDVQRCARRLGLPLAGPPAHPFRSLEALRVACVFRRESTAVELCVALADAAWGEGRDLEDPSVLADVVRSVGLPAEGLATRCRAPEIKTDLRQLTTGAVATGVFGVPTFIYDEELFWGHDRLDHLADRIAGRLGNSRREGEQLLSRPASARRRAAPGSRDPAA